MPTKSLDWVQGPWLVQLQIVNRSSYDRLQLDNMMFPHWIISYVQEGDVTTGSGGEVHRVRAGDVMLHPPHLPFSEHAESPGTHLWMQASILCAQHFDLLQLYRVSPVITIHDPVHYEAVFLKLFACWNNRDLPFRDLKLTSAMLQLTELVLSGWERAGCSERSEAYDSAGDRFARLAGQMSVRMAERLSREQLAALVRLNANYLDRAFRRQYGLTPMQMLRDMRLTRAKHLLEQTDDSLESIAAQCGLTDASYLCKQFKQQYGILPGKYRESVRIAQSADMYGSARST